MQMKEPLLPYSHSHHSPFISSNRSIHPSANGKKIALLPNLITAFGLSCGLFAIFKMNMVEVGNLSEQSLTAAAGLLLMAALADVIDGALARAMKAESDFGGLFDSLADAISFGVAPPVIVIKSLSPVPGTHLSCIVTAAALTFSLCGVLRLVRFGVHSMEAKGNEALTREHCQYFTGLPIPAAAAALVSLNLLLVSDIGHLFHRLSPGLESMILSMALFALGYFMVSRWKFPSIKTLHIHVSSFQTVVVTVLAAVAVFYGLLHYFAIFFVLVSWTYLIGALFLAISRNRRGEQTAIPDEGLHDGEDELE